MNTLYLLHLTLIEWAEVPVSTHRELMETETAKETELTVEQLCRVIGFEFGWRPTTTGRWTHRRRKSLTPPSGPMLEFVARFRCRRASSGTRCCAARTSTRSRASSSRCARTSA